MAVALAFSSVFAVATGYTANATPSVPDINPGQQSQKRQSLQQSTAPTDIVRPDTKFMKIPFKKSDASSLTITNGWKMSADEAKVIGDSSDHAAVDYEGVKYGTPLYAPADGWAWYSYQSYPMRYEAPYNPANPSDPKTFWKDPHTHREGYLGAAGLFVEMQFNKEVKRPDGSSLGNITTQFFHMKDVAPGIKYLPPVRQADITAYNGQAIKIWQPLVNVPQDQMRAQATPIKQGQLIGWVGDTGINFGYDDDFNVETGKVAPRDRAALPPWDPQGVPKIVPPERAAQIHQQSYTGRTAEAPYSKQNSFDIYDLYAETGFPNKYTPIPGMFNLGKKQYSRQTT